jgi:hypothetical protein
MLYYIKIEFKYIINEHIIILYHEFLFKISIINNNMIV